MRIEATAQKTQHKNRGVGARIEDTAQIHENRGYVYLRRHTVRTEDPAQRALQEIEDKTQRAHCKNRGYSQRTH